MNKSSFVSSKSHLRHSLHQKKKAAEDHRLLVETYGEHAPVIRTCETWFRQFKSGDFDLTDNVLCFVGPVWCGVVQVIKI